MSRPEFIKHWTELAAPDAHSYQGDTEPMGLDAPPWNKRGVTKRALRLQRSSPNSASDCAS